MSKPSDIPQDVWRLAEEVGHFIDTDDQFAAIARAVLAEREEQKRRTSELEREISGLRHSYFEERKKAIAERESCAKIADAYAEENMRMAGDTILTDPIIHPRGRIGPATDADVAKSNELQLDGAIHSAMYHAATNIAEAIRNRK